MATKIKKWDSAQYLETEVDIQSYMNAVLEEGGDDPAFIVHALGVIARAKNMSQLSRDTGLSREGLYKALSEKGNPTFATVTKIAKALGLQIRFESAA
jgi:probable addiction module antidote protein